MTRVSVLNRTNFLIMFGVGGGEDGEEMHTFEEKFLCQNDGVS